MLLFPSSEVSSLPRKCAKPHTQTNKTKKKWEPKRNPNSCFRRTERKSSIFARLLVRPTRRGSSGGSGGGGPPVNCLAVFCNYDTAYRTTLSILTSNLPPSIGRFLVSMSLTKRKPGRSRSSRMHAHDSNSSPPTSGSSSTLNLRNGWTSQQNPLFLCSLGFVFSIICHGNENKIAAECSVQRSGLSRQPPARAPTPPGR